MIRSAILLAQRANVDLTPHGPCCFLNITQVVLVR
jgi:hypothetical protein